MCSSGRVNDEMNVHAYTLLTTNRVIQLPSPWSGEIGSNGMKHKKERKKKEKCWTISEKKWVWFSHLYKRNHTQAVKKKFLHENPI